MDYSDCDPCDNGPPTIESLSFNGETFIPDESGNVELGCDDTTPAPDPTVEDCERATKRLCSTLLDGDGNPADIECADGTTLPWFITSVDPDTGRCCWALNADILCSLTKRPCQQMAVVLPAAPGTDQVVASTFDMAVAVDTNGDPVPPPPCGATHAKFYVGARAAACTSSNPTAAGNVRVGPSPEPGNCGPGVDVVSCPNPDGVTFPVTNTNSAEILAPLVGTTATVYSVFQYTAGVDPAGLNTVVRFLGYERSC